VNVAIAPLRPLAVADRSETLDLRWASLPAALLVIAFSLGTYTVRMYRANGGVQDFYQPEFGPAVMLACGRGYHPPDVTRLPQLQAFLRLELDRFDCASLPVNVPLNPSLSSVQRVSRYLEVSVVHFS
jgi:hypothetical protein